MLLATGVTNRRPAMPEALHDAALAQGRLRYCPICDGYEVTDQRVAVIGTGDHGVKEAIFLRSYTASVSLFAADGAHALNDADRKCLAEIGVRVIDGPARDFVLTPDGLSFQAERRARGVRERVSGARLRHPFRSGGPARGGPHR